MSKELTKNQLKVVIGEPILTRYERARIVGARALQISHGAPVLIETDNNDFRPHDVANKELKARVLPIGLARRLPNGRIQVIPLHWLKDREFITQIDVDEDEISTSPSPGSKPRNVLSEIQDITLITGIGEKKIDDFHEHGFTSVSLIAQASPKDLQKIPGIGPATAKKIIANAKGLVN